MSSKNAYTFVTISWQSSDQVIKIKNKMLNIKKISKRG
jgi:hypothetical protein